MQENAQVSLLRLYILRAAYALLAVAETAIQLPLFIHHATHWTETSGVAHSFTLALAVLSFLGIRYPLKMLPLLVFELLWKAIWLLGFALPLWLANQIDAETQRAFFEIAPVVVIIPIIPWRYIWEKFIRERGDSWLSGNSAKNEYRDA